MIIKRKSKSRFILYIAALIILSIFVICKLIEKPVEHRGTFVMNEDTYIDNYEETYENAYNCFDRSVLNGYIH